MVELSEGAFLFALRWVQETESSVLMSGAVVPAAVRGLADPNVSASCARLLARQLLVNDLTVHKNVDELVPLVLDSYTACREGSPSTAVLCNYATVLSAIMKVIFYASPQLLAYEHTAPVVEALCDLTLYSNKTLQLTSEFWWILRCSGPSRFASFAKVALRVLPQLFTKLIISDDMSLSARCEVVRPTVLSLVGIATPESAAKAVWDAVCSARGSCRIGTLEAGAYFLAILAEEQLPVQAGLSLLRDVCDWCENDPSMQATCTHTGVLSDLLYKVSPWLQCDAQTLLKCMHLTLGMVHKPYYKQLIVRLCTNNGRLLLPMLPKLAYVAAAHNDPDTCAAIGAILKQLPQGQLQQQLRATHEALTGHEALRCAVACTLPI